MTGTCAEKRASRGVRFSRRVSGPHEFSPHARIGMPGSLPSFIGLAKIESSAPENTWASALSDGALKQAFGKGRGHQDTDGYRTGGLTGDGYTFRVTAKSRNILLDPFKCGDLIHQAVVSGRVVRRLAS